jgi:hypothetical protein
MRQLIPLSGEPDDARSVEVATHWVHLYRKLLTFEEEVLATVRLRSRRMPDQVRIAVEESNIEPLAGLIDQMGRRLAYWEGRLAELS